MLLNLFNIEMANPNNVEEEFNKKFLTKSKFAEEIESFVQRHELSYIDSIVEYCEKNNIDIESVSKLISKPLKERLKCEAMELNFLKKTTRAKLPL